MLNRGVVRSLADKFWPIAPMALTKQMIATRVCGYHHSNGYNESCRMQSKAFVDLGIAAKFAPALTLKGCMSWRDAGFGRNDTDDVGKARVMAPHRHVLRDSEVLPLEELGARSLNGNGACRHGKPLGFPDHPASKKLVVAVDVDEDLGRMQLKITRLSGLRSTILACLRRSISEIILPWMDNQSQNLRFAGLLVLRS